MKNSKTLTLLLVFTLMLAAGSAAFKPAPISTSTQTQSTTETPAAPKPVIIDSDMAVDDWGAILYVLQNKNANVLGVFLSGDGEATCDPGVDNILRLVTLAGHDPIPVACASPKPLAGSNSFPDSWRGAVNDFNGREDIQPAKNTATKENAVQMMKELLTDASEPVTFLVTGPTSNVARLVRDYPEVKDKIARFYVMGGAVLVDGNVAPNNYAEWNFYIDPKADNILLRSGIPITLGSLDYTNNIPLTKNFVSQMKGRQTTAAAQFLYSYEKANPWRIGSGNYLWDQSTAVMMMNDSIVQFEDVHACVAEEGEYQGAIQPDTECPLHQFGVKADPDEIFEEYWQVINGEK
jgi:inosine-uridine nucleoside N-ribohydrolase